MLNFTKVLAGGKYCHCGDDCNTSCICKDCDCNIGLNLSDANAYFYSVIIII